MSWYFELAGGRSRGSELALSACLPSITRDHNQDLSLHFANGNINQRRLFVPNETLDNILLGVIILSISSQSTGKHNVILTRVISVSRVLLLYWNPGLGGRDSSVRQYQRQSHFQDTYYQTRRWGTMGWCGLCSSPTASRKLRNDDWINPSMCYMVQGRLTTQAANSHACSSGGRGRLLICPYHLHSYLSS